MGVLCLRGSNGLISCRVHIEYLGCVSPEGINDGAGWRPVRTAEYFLDLAPQFRPPTQRYLGIRRSSSGVNTASSASVVGEFLIQSTLPLNRGDWYRAFLIDLDHPDRVCL